MDPAGFAAATSLASYLFGGIGYAFIIAMAATSFDRTAAAIRPARLAPCCTFAGGYYLWLQFMRSRSASGFPPCRCTALFLIPLLVVLALRLIADGAARGERPVQADSLAAASAFDQQMDCRQADGER